MTDFNDFLDEGAKAMAAERPDLWGFDEARSTLHRWSWELIEQGGPGSISSGGFVLSRDPSAPAEGEYDWSLTRNVVNFDSSDDCEDELRMFVWKR